MFNIPSHHHAYRVRYGFTSVLVTMLALLCLGPGTHSFSKDEDSAETHVPAELVEKVKALLLKRFPGDEVSDNQEPRFHFWSHCQEFRTHSNGKYLTWPVKSMSLKMPASDGIAVEMEWSDDDAKVGGAGDGRWGQVTGE